MGAAGNPKRWSHHTLKIAKNHGAVFLGDELLTAALTASLLTCQIPVNSAFSFLSFPFLFLLKQKPKHFQNHAPPNAVGVFCGLVVRYFVFYVMLGLHTPREPTHAYSSRIVQAFKGATCLGLVPPSGKAEYCK